MRRVRRQDAASSTGGSSLTSGNVTPSSSSDNLVSPTDTTTSPTTSPTGSTTSTTNTNTTPTSTSTTSGSSTGTTSGQNNAPTQPPDQRNPDPPPNTTDESLTSVYTSMSGTRLVTVTAVVPNPSASLQRSGTPTSFWDNRAAVIATFTLVGIAVVAILGVAITASFRRKRRNRGSHGGIPRDSHFLDDDDNDSRFYQALSEKSAVSAGISPAAASFSEKWGSGPTRHPYASPPVGADQRRTIVELPVEPISRPPSAFLSLHPSTRPPSLVPPFDPSMFPPGPRSVSDDHHHVPVRPASAAWDHPQNPGGHPFAANQYAQDRSLPQLPDQPLHQHAPALQHARQFSDPMLLNRLSQMMPPESSPTPPPPSPGVNRHHSFGANAMLGLGASGVPPNRHHSLGASSLLMPMTSRTPSPQPSNYDPSVYTRTPGSSADYGNGRRGTGDWSGGMSNHTPSQSSGSNYTYIPPAHGYDRSRDPRFSAAFGVPPSRSGASLSQAQQAYYAHHPQYAHPPPPMDPRYSGMMMGGGGRPGTGSSSASVAYTYGQPHRPPTSQSFRSKNTISRPGTGESNVTTSSEQIQYLRRPGDMSASSSVTTHVDELDLDELPPAVSATSLNTTTTETRAESSTTHTHAHTETDRSKGEGSDGPPRRLFLAGDSLPKDNSDATSLKDDVDYTPGWIGALLIANE